MLRVALLVAGSASARKEGERLHVEGGAHRSVLESILARKKMLVESLSGGSTRVNAAYLRGYENSKNA